MDAIAIWNYSNYRKDLDLGAGFHFNSNQSRLHTALNTGDSLWLVTRIVANGHNEYRLAARLVIRAKTINAPSYKYGSYRVWGDVKGSSYFRIDETSEQDVFELLRLLEMDSGSLTGKTRSDLFQAMQTMRCIPPKSSKLLDSFAAQLSLEMRAYQVMDEPKLEKAYAASNEKQLELLLMEEAAGYSETAKSAIKHSYERNRKLVKNLHELYNGRCQVTGHDSPLLYGVPTAEAHHVVYRSRGGADEMENLVLVSPNLHTAIHAASATFDYASLAFIFPNGRVEPLILNTHLTKRAA
jgi:5-methylcytosine-specific restriction enzyme A